MALILYKDKILLKSSNCKNTSILFVFEFGELHVLYFDENGHYGLWAELG